MSLTRPVHEWETLNENDPLAGRTWTVRSEHHGHTMSVVGRISDSSMLVVACSCGEEFRMADVTVEKKVRA